MKSKIVSPWLYLVGLALVLPFVTSCDLFRYPHPFDNPIDPGLSYEVSRTVGEMEYTDGRGVAHPWFMQVHPDGHELILVAGYRQGWGAVDPATGSLRWEGLDWYHALAVDHVRDLMYGFNGKTIRQIDTQTWGDTQIYAVEDSMDLETIAVSPDGELAVVVNDGGNRHLQVVSAAGVLRWNMGRGVSSILGLAFSTEWIFVSQDGIITLCDPATGDAVATISWDTGGGQFVRNVYPTGPLDPFSPERLCYDPATGRLLCSFSGSGPGIPACYIFDPNAALPLVGTVGDSNRISTGDIAVMDGGDVYMSSWLGYVENLTTGQTVYQNPPLRDNEFLNVPDITLGDGDRMRILDRELRFLRTYDQETDTYATIDFPDSGPGAVSGDADRIAEGSSGIWISESSRVTRSDTDMSYIEEWAQPIVDAPAVDLDILPDGSALVLYDDVDSPISAYRLIPGDPLPRGPFAFTAFPLALDALTGAQLAVAADGSLVMALAIEGEAHWGSVAADLDAGTLSYNDVWSSAADSLLGGGSVDAWRFRIDALAAGPECVWVSFPDLGLMARFDPAGTVLGALGYTAGAWGWRSDALFVAEVTQDRRIAIDSRGRLLARVDPYTLLLFTPR